MSDYELARARHPRGGVAGPVSPPPPPSLPTRETTMKTFIPRLKTVPVNAHDGTVVLNRRSLERIHLADPSGAVLDLLKALSAGRYALDQIPAALRDSGTSTRRSRTSPKMVHQLDQWGLLERADPDDQLDARTVERHSSNLHYYDLFSDLSPERHRHAPRRRRRDRVVAGRGWPWFGHSPIVGRLRL